MIMNDPVSENEKMSEKPKSMVHHDGSCERYPTTETDMVNSNTDSDQIQSTPEAIHELKGMKQSLKESKVEITKKTSALMNIMEYSDDELTDVSSDQESEKVLVCPQNYRKTVSSESSDTDTESDVSEDKKSKSVDSDVEIVSVGRSSNDNYSLRKPEHHPNTYGEILPPVADLSNLVIDENDEFLHIGNVHSIVETVVTISSVPDSPAYDLETVLFIEKGSKKIPLGEIFDVIGPVSSPFYCVRLQSDSDIKEKEIKRGITKVFSIPRSSRTHYIFVKQLMEAKYTDASGEHDVELNADDTSDEESNQCLPDDQPPPNRRRKRTDHALVPEGRADRDAQAQELSWTTASYLTPQGVPTYSMRSVGPNLDSLLGQQRALPPFISTFNQHVRPHNFEPQNFDFGMRGQQPSPQAFWNSVLNDPSNNFAAQPPQHAAYPQLQDALPPQQPAYPQFQDARLPQQPAYPRFQDAGPPQQPAYPQFQDARPSQQPAYPQRQDPRHPQVPGNPQFQVAGPPPAHASRPFHGEMHNPRHPRDSREGYPTPPNPMNLQHLDNQRFSIAHRGPAAPNMNYPPPMNHPHPNPPTTNPPHTGPSQRGRMGPRQ